VQQQLVAARGHAVDQRLDGIGAAHLIRADLGPQRDEQLDRVTRGDRQVGRAIRGGGDRGRGGLGGRRGRGGGLVAGVVRRGGGLVGGLRLVDLGARLIAGEDLIAVALHVPDGDVAVGVARQRRGAGRQVRDG